MEILNGIGVKRSRQRAKVTLSLGPPRCFPLRALGASVFRSLIAPRATPIALSLVLATSSPLATG